MASVAFQVDISSDDVWKKEVLGNPGTLQVLEVYQSWCGPCKAVVNTFRRMYFDLADRPLKFYTVNCTKVQALDAVKYQHKTRCEPVFLLMKDGKVLKEVVGVNTPVLSQLVQQLSAEAVKGDAK